MEVVLLIKVWVIDMSVCEQCWRVLSEGYF